MVSRDGAFGILMGAAVGMLFLVPAHGSAQNSLSVSCESVQFLSPFEDLIRCAEEGDVEAQSSLGLRYYAGGAAPLDYAEALRWFRLAAEQGSAEAQVMLGVMNANGMGVPEDDAKALQWYLMAAEQGDATGQVNLGFMYGNGDGIPENLVSAYMWYNLSAAQGNETAQSNKDIIEQRMTREQIAEAQRLSREWTETHPQDGGN